MTSLLSRLTGFVDLLLLRTNPLGVVIICFFGFMTIVASLIIGIGVFEYKLEVEGKTVSKQVGFVWALNWSMTLIFLLPILVIFGLESYRGFRRSFKRLVSRNMVSNKDGSIVNEEDLFDAWKGILLTVATIGGLTLCASLIYAYWEYNSVVGRHFADGQYPTIDLKNPYQEADWSVAALLPGTNQDDNSINPVANNTFSLIMYLLVPGLGTGIVFSFFFLFTGFFFFLYWLSDRYLLLPHVSDKDPRRGFQIFSEMVGDVIRASIIVLVICYLMIIQNLYLRDDATSIVDFMFSDFKKNGSDEMLEGKISNIISFLEDGLLTSHTHPGAFNLQGSLSFALSSLVLVLIIFFFSFLFNRLIKHCQARALERLRSGLTLPSAAEGLDNDEQFKRVTEMNCWPVAWTPLKTLLWLFSCAFICIVFYKIGLFFVGMFMAYCMLKVFRVIRSKADY